MKLLHFLIFTVIAAYFGIVPMCLLASIKSIFEKGEPSSMRRIKKKLHRLTATLLDMPEDVVFELPRMTLIGDRQLYIENHRGVIHFSEEVLRLSLSKGELEVTGDALIIRTIWTDEVFVEGVIRGIQLFP